MWFRSYLTGLVVFLTSFILSLNFAIRSSQFEPQSAPGLLFADFIELFLWLQRTESVWFQYWSSGDGHVEVVYCVIERGCLLWPVHSLSSVSLCPALLCAKGPTLCVIPSVFWLLLLHSNPPWWKSIWLLASLCNEILCSFMLGSLL